MRRIGPLLTALAATLALGYLAAMVAIGAMPVQRQLVRFEAKGVLTLSPDSVRRVTIGRGDRTVTLVRTGENAWRIADGADVGPSTGAQVDTAVKVLHRSGPVSEIAAAELTDLDTRPFGLEPPALEVAVFGDGPTPALTARFGARNPEGILQYMRLEGDGRVYLMSGFVAAEWITALEGIEPP